MALYLDRRLCLLRLFPLDLACRITQYLLPAPGVLEDSLGALQKSGDILMHWRFRSRISTDCASFKLRQCKHCHHLVVLEVRQRYSAAGYVFLCPCISRRSGAGGVRAVLAGGTDVAGAETGASRPGLGNEHGAALAVHQ